MACHLAGGSCPHDFGFGGRSDYLTSGSSSYGRMSIYAVNPKYGAAYRGAGTYVGQTKSANTGNKKNEARTKLQNPFSNYRGNTASEEREVEENTSLAEQPRDIARPAGARNTIDDTVDATSAVAVQRNFLEQMIEQARAQTVANQQPQYRLMYQ